MNRYEHSSFVIAAVLSIAVHATAVVYVEHDDVPAADQSRSAASVMRISLAPARPAAPEPKPQPPPPKKPVPKHKAKQAPLPKPINKPRPTTHEVLEITEPVEKQAVASTRSESPINKSPPAPTVLKNKRESYLLKLLAHIDNNKFYPRNARRRGMEGEIQVAFYLLRDGSIRDLQVKGGSKVLRKAAKQAVQRALSLPLPPESIHLQDQIRFGMVYRLDG